MANPRKSMLVVSLLMMALCGVSMAAVYQVGDSAGWTSMGQVDYYMNYCRQPYMDAQTSIETRRYAAVIGNKAAGIEICGQLASNGIVVILIARNVTTGLEAAQKIKD